MSMIGNYVHISAEQLALLQADPGSISDLLDSLYPDEQGDEDDEPAPPKIPHLDIDKAWHGIHFLLNDSAWEGDAPLFNVVLGGTELGDEDVGYGPARYLTPEEVQETAHAISQVSVDDLLRRYDPRRMTKAEIYPEIIWERDRDEALQYLLDYYVNVVAFFREAARHGQAMLLFMD
jgi:hypothetical protein